MGHTPGPWTWIEDRYSWTTNDSTSYSPSVPQEWADVDALMGPEGYPILEGIWHNNSTAGLGIQWPNARANARLIAAAPDLLDALHGLVQACSRTIDAEEFAIALADARAAIAKADGHE